MKLALLCRIMERLDRMETMLKQMDATLTAQGVVMSTITDAIDALNAKVAALETVEDSAVALLQGLKAQLDAALALGDPASIVAAVQAVSDKVGADTQKLADAVTANTPAAP